MKLNPWIKTTIIATIGGGLAGALAASMDPQKYNWRHDIGSGKLWEFFIEGAVTVGLATLIKSPFGQQVMTSFKDSQQQLKDSQQTVADTKTELKDATKPK